MPAAKRLAILRTWPLPALLAWAAAWALFRLVLGWGWGHALALGLASALGVAASLWGHTWWRRLFIAAGFPLSLVLSLPAAGLAAVPAWAWLVPLGLLLLVYPLNAWRDAPLFPTPRHALDALPGYAALAPGARVLDAGCGLGAGLRALRRAYPQAQLHGLEWSWPLRAACALRCPWAQVRRGDIWRADWSGYDLVYLFQRPESMARALHKAHSQMRSGSWLVSLEFQDPAVTPTHTLTAPDGRPVWLYRMP